MRPNILFISVDQQRWDCLGFNGRYPVKTPNIDRLAAEGICFDNSFTPLPTCCPAREALVCGKRPERFGAYWNYDAGIKVASLPKDAFSWARSLAESGYRTGYVGKWHVSPDFTPLDYGYEDYVEGWSLGDRKRELHSDKKYKKGFFGEVSPYPYEDEFPHVAAEKTIELIDKYGTDTWHIKFDMAEPHLPCRPAEPFASMYDRVPKWASFDDPLEGKPYMHKQMQRNWNTQDMTWDDLHETARLYYGFISEVDHAIGTVIDHLEKTGRLDRTVIIYTSDHGDMCGDRHMMDKHYIMYDEVTRTPLVIRYPAVIAPGTRCDEPVTNMLDIVPTVLELADLPVPDDLDGVTLMPYLKGEEHPAPRKYALTTYNGQQFGLYSQRMIRDKKWKYVWNLSDVDELYDMENDPSELRNLARDPDYADLLRKLRLDLVHELDQVEDYTVTGGWLRDMMVNNLKY